MQNPHQRLAARIPCRVPLRLRIDGTWHEVHVVDISRTGVRVQVPMTELGLEPGASFAETVAHLAVHLPRQVPTEFEPGRLGGLVSRCLRIVRISFPHDAPGSVEIGGALDHELGDTEAAALGLPLPPALERPASPSGDGDRATGEGAGDRPDHPLHVALWPLDKAQQEPLVVVAEAVDEHGVRLRLEDPHVPGLEQSDGDVRPLATAFAEAYGPTAVIGVYDGGEPLWQGPARLTHVEVEDGPALVVGFAYDRPLEASELEALLARSGGAAA